MEYSGTELHRVADGLLAEEWIASDTESLMTQLTGAGEAVPDA
ncbi:hypothetical protein ACFZDK_45175 [Streptomyces sp. NPDC007901]